MSSNYLIQGSRVEYELNIDSFIDNCRLDIANTYTIVDILKIDIRLELSIKFFYFD